MRYREQDREKNREGEGGRGREEEIGRRGSNRG